ncbi:MAG: hypothetical protein ACRYFX_11360 [Janthinobacterium lividum]
MLKKALSGAAGMPTARTSTQRMGTPLPAEYHRAVLVARGYLHGPRLPPRIGR